jgi:RHS repeat-associated protein
MAFAGVVSDKVKPALLRHARFKIRPSPIIPYPTSGAGVVRPHAATVVGTYSLTYDNNGNMLTLTDPAGFYGYSASYNVDNRMSSVIATYAGVPTTTTFIYDGDGGRMKKIVGTTTTRYISKLYECDTTGANTSCSRFIWAGDKRIATVAVTSGAVHYWHGDHLGSSSVITDSTGAKVQALTYYPYGDIRTNVPGTPVNVPYKYTGKELDTSSNLYFYESRYYHAIFGRFISPDTIVPNLYDPQSLNRYSYARNNPLIYTDPTGHFFKNIFKHVFRNVGRVFSRHVNEVFRIANEIGHKPLNLISPTFWLESSYSLHPALAPFRAAGLREELDSGQRAINKFRNSNTGRYVDAGVITTGAIVAAAFCGGCTAPGIGAIINGAYIGAAVGTTSGLAQAGFTGGDPFQAAALGGLIGAAGGAIGAGVGGLAENTLSIYATKFLGDTALGSLVPGAAKIGGTIAGSSLSGGFSAGVSGANIGKGFGFGALGGFFSTSMALSLSEPLGKFSPLLGDALDGSIGGNMRDAPRRFVDGGVDWTGGWFGTQAENN